VSDIIDGMCAQLAQRHRHGIELKTGLRDCTAASLTEEEKFAICYLAGVPVSVGPDNKLRTAVSCAVTKVGNKWLVARAAA